MKNRICNFMSKTKWLWVLWSLTGLAACITIKNYYDDFALQSIRDHAFSIPAKSWDVKYQDFSIKDSYKVVYVTCSGGEYSAAEYFKFAAEQKGWQVKVYYQTIIGKENEILDFDPDFFVIAWLAEPFELDSRIVAHRSKKYYWVPMSLEVMNKFGFVENDLTTPKKHFKKWISKAHGLLLGVEGEMDIYRLMCDKLKKPFYGINIMPLPPENNYEPAEPRKIVWGGLASDKLRFSQKYKKLINLLSKHEPMRVYGAYGIFSYLKPDIYGGYVPPGIENINAIRRNGIYLLTHSRAHFTGHVPSMRLFEAAASNTITISDKHPFTIQHFGDNMLYFDQEASANDIYKQLQKHIDWVRANPQKAKEMAARAHKIFLEKFALEKDLIRIAKMHEYILDQEKTMGLEYNLAY